MRYVIGWLLSLLCVAALQADELVSSTGRATVLGIDGTRFTLNGQPTFLLGISYYGGLGAPEDFIRRDLDELTRHGFNWLRIWATWDMSEHSVSAVGADGRQREPFFERLKWLVAECDRRALVVDVTLTRSGAGQGLLAEGRLSSFAAHQQAVESLVNGLRDHRNWYLDLANERDVRDDRYVPAAELKTMRELVHRLDPTRLVTASFGGHDLSEQDVRESVLTVGVGFLSPHRPRHAASPAETEAHTRACLAFMKKLDRTVPVHYQEPFRRGYGRWEPAAEDYLKDLRGAFSGGAAGWCLHNGAQRTTPDNQPRRSFDMRQQRLFDQLDDVERTVVAQASSQLEQLNK